MLLVFDIGNTTIVAGCFKGEKLVCEFRLQSDTGKTVDEYVATMDLLFERQLEKNQPVRGAIICSVVPPLTGALSRVVAQLFNVEPLIVGPGIKTGIALRVTEPASVGADRVVNALAARELYGKPSLVVDFGTATTFDLVNKDGEYEGGIIAPGVLISLESLVQKTAKLPRIDLAWPEKVVGKNTVHAMQSGILRGYVCMVDGIIEQVRQEVGDIPHIIATGGFGELIVSHSSVVKIYEPTLTLQGMRLIAGLNGLS